MIKIIDISFFTHLNNDSISTLVNEHKAALGYIDHLKKRADVQVIKHLVREDVEIINGTCYSGFKGSKGFANIPFKTLRFIKNQKPDVVIVQGLVFPVQVILLRLILGKSTKILVQHHGESPFKGIKKRLQIMAGHFISGYLFTALENAEEWKRANIIKKKTKCFELPEASTHFKKQDKLQSREINGLTGQFNFLWVGRLNKGKDPLTVIHAFIKYAANNPEARLWMIYQAEELLPEIKIMIEQHADLRQRIVLLGKIGHEELQSWFSAADFYISGSHREGSGYALLEAMACGCIPVVTAIASFKKITQDGKYGLLYRAGNAGALFETLMQLNKTDLGKMPEDIIEHFQQALSFSSIAEDLYAICEKLTKK